MNSWSPAIDHMRQHVPPFNHHRLLGPIGYITPEEAESNYYRQLATPSAAVAA